MARSKTGMKRRISSALSIWRGNEGEGSQRSEVTVRQEHPFLIAAVRSDSNVRQNIKQNDI